MNELSSKDLVDYIKVRQLKQSMSINEKLGRHPLLAVLHTIDDPVINKFMALKSKYASDIQVDVVLYKETDESIVKKISELNKSDDVDGIIVQLPLEDVSKTDNVLDSVDSNKDVDGLTSKSIFDPPTPTAILWLLAAYNIELTSKKILIIGQGRLVGLPLTAMMENSGLDVDTADINTKDIPNKVTNAQIIISAVGRANLLKSDDVAPNSIVIDAGTSEDNGQLVGDADQKLRTRLDVQITPKVGGVGPLTITSLFENLLRAADL